MIAATAIQKSTGVTRCSRRSSATSIMPNTTASMITAPSTAFGRSEKSRASTSSVASTRPPVTSDATGVRAPADSFSELAERLVDTGMPWNTPAPMFAIPLRDGLLVDVDAVAMARCERPGIAGGLGEPDQQQCEGGDRDGRVVVPEHLEIGHLGDGQATRHVADECDVVRSEIEESRAVVTGFLAGAAVDVVIGELPKLTGTSAERQSAWCELASWLGSLGDLRWATLLVGVSALAVILGLRYLAPTIPGALVLAGGLIASSLRNWAIHPIRKSA